MGVRSEYQKHFKVSALKKSLPVYYENVAFRTARREREYSHTPLSWYDEDDADSVDTDSVEDNQTDQTEKPSEGKVESQAVEKPSEGKIVNSRFVENPSQKTDSCSVGHLVKETLSSADSPEDSTTVSPQQSDDKNHSLQMKPQKIHKNETAHPKGSKTFVVKPKKQWRPDRKQKIAPHPKKRTSAPHSARLVEHPAPFMSYGWGDVERDLCQHKTFNVRATADVHPAALRAQTRRKTACERRVESAKKSAEDRVKAMLEAAVRERAQEGVEWRSEYQQRYPAYDPREYMRSISARANERKLCRVVYVS